jgi:hypothetical protein
MPEKFQPEQPKKEAQKSVFEDERLQRLDELSRKELKQLERSIEEERANRLAPLERLADEYLEKWGQSEKDANELKGDTEELIGKFDVLIESIESQKHSPEDFGSAYELGHQIKQLMEEANSAMDEEERLFDVFRQIQEKVHELDEVYFQLEQKVGKVREQKEADLMKEFESWKDEG